jgi:hypothetical protein
MGCVHGKGRSVAMLAIGDMESAQRRLVARHPSRAPIAGKGKILFLVATLSVK